MKIRFSLLLISVFVLNSCTKQDKAPKVEKESYPGRVKSVAGMIFYYDKQGFLTYGGDQGDDWTTFVWDKTNKNVRIIPEGDFGGIKEDINFYFNDIFQILGSVDMQKEKILYDSLNNPISYVYIGYNNSIDSINYTWDNGNVISKSHNKFKADTLNLSYSYLFEYSEQLETRNFGINPHYSSTLICLN